MTDLGATVAKVHDGQQQEEQDRTGEDRYELHAGTAGERGFKGTMHISREL